MFPRFTKAAAALVLGAACAASAAQARPVTYELKGTGAIGLTSVFSGFHAGAGTYFDITATGDTDNVKALPGGFINDLSNVDIFVGGCAYSPAVCVHSGTYHMTSPGRIGNDTSNHLAFLLPTLVFFSTDNGSPLLTYDLKSSLGPIQVYGLGGNPFNVTGPPFPPHGYDGEMQFFSIDGATFSAVVSSVPEPGAWTMLLVGLAGLGAALRIRRRAIAA